MLRLVDRAAVFFHLQVAAGGQLGVPDLAFAVAEVDGAEEVAEVFDLQLLQRVVLEGDGALVRQLHREVLFVDRVQLLVELLQHGERGDVADQVAARHDRVGDRPLVPVGQQVRAAPDVLFLVDLH